MLVAPGGFWLWWKSCRCCCPGWRMPRPGFPCVWGMMTARSLCHFGGCNISSKPQGSGPRQQEQIWWQQRAPLKSHWRRDLWRAHLFFSRWKAGPDIIVVAQHNFDGFSGGRQVLLCITLKNVEFSAPLRAPQRCRLNSLACRSVWCGRNATVAKMLDCNF